MIGDSELIEFDERLAMARVMPPRTDGHNWVLKYTTASDGFVSRPCVVIKIASTVKISLFLSTELKLIREKDGRSGRAGVNTHR